MSCNAGNANLKHAADVSHYLGISVFTKANKICEHGNKTMTSDSSKAPDSITQ